MAHVCVEPLAEARAGLGGGAVSIPLIVRAIVFGFVVFGDVPVIAMPLARDHHHWRRHLHLHPRASAAREAADPGSGGFRFYPRCSRAMTAFASAPRRRASSAERRIDFSQFNFQSARLSVLSAVSRASSARFLHGSLKEGADAERRKSVLGPCKSRTGLAGPASPTALHCGVFKFPGPPLPSSRLDPVRCAGH